MTKRDFQFTLVGINFMCVFVLATVGSPFVFLAAAGCALSYWVGSRL